MPKFTAGSHTQAVLDTAIASTFLYKFFIKNSIFGILMVIVGILSYIGVYLYERCLGGGGGPKFELEMPKLTAGNAIELVKL